MEVQKTTSRSSCALAAPILISLLASPLVLMIEPASANDKTPANAPVVITDGSVKLKPDARTTLLVSKSMVRPFVSTDNGTLTAGQTTFTCTNGAHNIARGYGVSPPIGSYSPTGLTGGKTVYVIDDNNMAGACLTNSAHVEISGFTANPGIGWLTSAKCNGVTNTGSAATFSYASGVATWTWSTRFGFVNATAYTCTLIHT